MYRLYFPSLIAEVRNHLNFSGRFSSACEWCVRPLLGSKQSTS